MGGAQAQSDPVTSLPSPPILRLQTCVPYPFPPSIPPPHVMHLVHPPPMMPFALEHQHPLREPLLPLRSLPEEITWGFHKARGQMDLQTKTPPPARPKRNAASSPPAECRGRAKRARFSRKGKWSEEEEQFANLLASNFKKGLIDVPEGVTLRFFIASQLGCDPMRVSKKFHGLESLGKLVFRADEFKNVTPEAKQKAAEEIAMAEARFLDRLRLDTDPQDQSTDESETKDGESKHLPLVKLWSRAIIKDTRDSATAIDWDLSDVLRRGSFEREVVVRSARAGSVSPKR
uniref:Uncharacterized protein n=1 Tax=Rhizochromulina marina TaxID=1034831 RepID=A0A7S2WTG3_9STRA|mmetsp:Transcript_33059/g.95739  ORF Transcript_33059/g.95739 Transcript_33059/m.95739 type:complete len:289 (+) Transcript_33059:592-1458(+)